MDEISRRVDGVTSLGQISGLTMIESIFGDQDSLDLCSAENNKWYEADGDWYPCNGCGVVKVFRIVTWKASEKSTVNAFCRNYQNLTLIQRSGTSLRTNYR